MSKTDLKRFKRISHRMFILYLIFEMYGATGSNIEDCYFDELLRNLATEVRLQNACSVEIHGFEATVCGPFGKQANVSFGCGHLEGLERVRRSGPCIVDKKYSSRRLNCTMSLDLVRALYKGHVTYLGMHLPITGTAKIESVYGFYQLISESERSVGGTQRETEIQPCGKVHPRMIRMLFAIILLAVALDATQQSTTQLMDEVLYNHLPSVSTGTAQLSNFTATLTVKIKFITAQGHADYHDGHLQNLTTVHRLGLCTAADSKDFTCDVALSRIKATYLSDLRVPYTPTTTIKAKTDIVNTAVRLHISQTSDGLKLTKFEVRRPGTIHCRHAGLGPLNSALEDLNRHLEEHLKPQLAAILDGQVHQAFAEAVKKIKF